MYCSEPIFITVPTLFCTVLLEKKIEESIVSLITFMLQKLADDQC